MITMELNGGLGNMLFQIAAAESLSPSRVRYDFESNFKVQAECGRPVYAYERLFSTFQLRVNSNAAFPRACMVKVPFEYAPVKLIEGATYSGYFQSERFMDVELVRRIFEWAEPIRTEIERHDMTGTCAVHVRRGDYLKHPTVHPVQPAEYYHQAVKLLKPQRILIFSDDLAWCAKHLSFEAPSEVIEAPDYIALALMSRCGSAVISNSSFSWWGAWLANCPTVAPATWFGPDGPSDRDVVPARWVRL